MTSAGFDSAVVAAQPGVAVVARYFRTVADRWRDQVASAVGSSRVDGRYHTAAEDRVLYLSSSPQLSMAEAARLFRTVPAARAAWFTCAFAVDLRRVLDLTSPEVLGRLGLTAAGLVQPGPSGFKLPQAVAAAARAAAFDALVAPSARPATTGHNLVIFLEVLSATGGSVTRER